MNVNLDAVSVGGNSFAVPRHCGGTETRVRVARYCLRYTALPPIVSQSLSAVCTQ